MGWFLFFLPLIVIMIMILRVQFPDYTKSFRSALVFLALFMALQFQNCSQQQNQATNTADFVK